MRNFSTNKIISNLNFYFIKIKRNLFSRVLFYYFLSLSIATLFLMTPWSWVDSNKSWDFLNSFYMCVSAISTTGLTIYDLGENMTVIGQFFILILILIGGIGLLFFKFWLFRMLGFIFRFNKKNDIISTREQHLERGYFRLQNTKEMILIGFFFIFSVQIIGFLILFFYFYFVKIDKLNYYLQLDKSLWSATFQFVFVVQFILGGLGFPVFFEFWSKFKNRKKEGIKTKITFFTKFVLYSYFLILFFSLIIVFILELSISSSKLRNEFNINNFFSVIFNTLSTRSAGYSTVNIDSFFTDATKHFMIFLMWVGCAPISTGGGIKVTTFAVLFLSLFRWYDSKNNLLIKNKKSISFFDVILAYKIVFITFFIIFVFCTYVLIENLLFTENSLLNAVFYSTSALGNAGLTLLNPKKIIKGWHLFKIISIFLMFFGQIGISQIILLGRNKRNKFANNIETVPQETLF